MEVIWSDFAINNLKEIYTYYKSKAGKKTAQKLKRQILETSKQLINNPESGQIELFLKKLQQNHRYLLSGNYKIIYRIEKDQILIIDIFDVRQHPGKMIDTTRNG